MLVRISILLFALAVLAAANEPVHVQGFEGLAQEHCKRFPVELIWRLATGRISELYGPRFKELDGYIRQYIGYGTQRLTKTILTILFSRRHSPRVRRIRTPKHPHKKSHKTIPLL